MQGRKKSLQLGQGEIGIALRRRIWYTLGNGKDVLVMRADCHMHMILDGYDWKAAIGRHRETVDEEWIRQRLEDYQRLGFVYLRDGGDRWGGRSKSQKSGAGIRHYLPDTPGTSVQKGALRRVYREKL